MGVMRRVYTEAAALNRRSRRSRTHQRVHYDRREFESNDVHALSVATGMVGCWGLATSDSSSLLQQKDRQPDVRLGGACLEEAKVFSRHV
jgi:hypothetical protein